VRSMILTSSAFSRLRCWALLDLFELALAEVGGGDGVGQFLGDGPRYLNIDRLNEACQFFERVLSGPLLARLFNGNQEGVLDRFVGGLRFA